VLYGRTAPGASRGAVFLPAVSPNAINAFSPIVFHPQTLGRYQRIMEPLRGHILTDSSTPLRCARNDGCGFVTGSKILFGWLCKWPIKKCQATGLERRNPSNPVSGHRQRKLHIYLSTLNKTLSNQAEIYKHKNYSILIFFEKSPRLAQYSFLSFSVIVSNFVYAGQLYNFSTH